ncbi:hypothetical protein NP493_123g05009 [Ridgeia piscesae]|uniref:Uncharacterized protein n=1 Tax=Ridgeia piscesae TaxID=27915 RepID=A0AAD9UGY0_RIDPI|nr:hypothetical protein NP493_123g05009 [Ridgeia piscesae]
MTFHYADVMRLYGCIGSFVHLKCHWDDVISVRNVRITDQSEGFSCHGQTDDIRVPVQAVSHPCVGDEACVDAKAVCSSASDCLLYVDPSFVSRDGKTRTDSGLVIDYECVAGPTRKACVAIGCVIASLGFLSILLASGILAFRKAQSRRREMAIRYRKFSNRVGRSDIRLSRVSSTCDIESQDGRPRQDGGAQMDVIQNGGHHGDRPHCDSMASVDNNSDSALLSTLL